MNKLDYYLDIALAVSKKSSCLKRHYGAVIVKDDIVKSTGYNGSCRGEAHCTTCTKVSNDKDIAEYLTCASVHAEMNAIIAASRPEMLGGDLYLTCWDNRKNQEIIDAQPCEICLRLIKNAGISRIINRTGVIYERDTNNILQKI
jgi:dCMP deaminase